MPWTPKDAYRHTQGDEPSDVPDTPTRLRAPSKTVTTTLATPQSLSQSNNTKPSSADASRLVGGWRCL